MRILRSTRDALAELIFPRHCYACGDVSATDLKMGVCRSCWEALRPIGPSICATCGKSLASPEAGTGWVDYKCETCRTAKRLPYSALRSLYRYDSPMREIIHLFKFEGMLPLGRELGRQLGKALVELPTMFSKVDAVVPVPLHPLRRFRRGFNQSALLARAVADSLKLPLSDKSLSRQRDTPPQSSLEPEKRKRSLRGAFVADGSLASGKCLLLVDDVVTTEATLRECARSLRKAGAKKVFCVTVARAETM